MLFIFLHGLSKAEEKPGIGESEPVFHIQDMDINTLLKALATP